MPFATPLALLGLLFVPAVVAMYLLKLRRTETVVPSTLLWQRARRRCRANAPWRRARRAACFLLSCLVVVSPLLPRAPLSAAAGLARDLLVVSTPPRAWARPSPAPDRLRRPRGRRRRGAQGPPPAAVVRHRGRPDGSGSCDASWTRTGQGAIVDGSARASAARPDRRLALARQCRPVRERCLVLAATKAGRGHA
jgi:hypothetical protein